MSTKAVIDCTPTLDDTGRSVVPRTPTMTEMSAGEQSALDALQALTVTVLGLPVVTGRVTVGIIDGVSKAVTFPMALRTADYVVVLNPASSLSVNLWATNKTATGFTLNLSLAASGTIEYIAHETT